MTRLLDPPWADSVSMTYTSSDWISLIREDISKPSVKPEEEADDFDVDCPNPKTFRSSNILLGII